MVVTRDAIIYHSPLSHGGSKPHTQAEPTLKETQRKHLLKIYYEPKVQSYRVAGVAKRK